MKPSKVVQVVDGAHRTRFNVYYKSSEAEMMNANEAGRMQEAAQPQNHSKIMRKIPGDSFICSTVCLKTHYRAPMKPLLIIQSRQQTCVVMEAGGSVPSCVRSPPATGFSQLTSDHSQSCVCFNAEAPAGILGLNQMHIKHFTFSITNNVKTLE